MLQVAYNDMSIGCSLDGWKELLSPPRFNSCKPQDALIEHYDDDNDDDGSKRIN